MSTSSVTSLDLSGNNLTYYGRNMTGITALADALKVNASVTVTDMRFNRLDTESATMLAGIAKEKGISLCGIVPGQIEANMKASHPNYMQPADAILLTADLAVRSS